MKTAKEWNKEFGKPKYAQMTEEQLIEIVQRDAWESATEEQVARDGWGGAHDMLAPFPKEDNKPLDN